MAEKRYILTLSCADVRGIVATVSGFLAQHNGFIIESAQFGDSSTGQFFLRMEFSTDAQTPPEDELKKRFFDQVAERFAMNWNLYDKARKMRVLIMVSKYGHCLNDILHRFKTGSLPIDVNARMRARGFRL